MAEQQESTPFDALCLDVLKAIGKTLSQMNLYSAAHPAVREMMAGTLKMLDDILAESGGEVAYSVDAGKVIANGRVIGALDQVPSSIGQIFDKFKLNSISFRTGVTQDELAVLCQMAALRPDAAKGVVPSEHMKEKGVEHISLNEALYAKVGAEPDGPAPVETAATAPAEPSQVASELVDMVDEQPLDKTLAKLVSHAVQDPNDQIKVLQSVMAKVQKDMEARVVEATREITQQKTVAQNYATRTQAVMGQMADGVVTVDDQGNVLMMNPEAEELFQARLAEAAGKNLPQLVKDEHMLSLAKDLTVPKDRELEGEAGVTANDDSARTLRASNIVVQDEAGKPVGMVASLSDKAKHRELQKKERAFVAHVTHELRAPLSSIRAALEILDEAVTGKLDTDDQKVMVSALSNTDRLEDLIRSILDFGKIESGQMEVFPKPCDAERIALQSVDSIGPWAQKRRITVRFEPGANLPHVLADASRCVQVMVNFLSNAVKFTPKGGAITVRAEPGTEKLRGFVIYSVKDSGPGIPKDKQAKVFEKFVQVSEGERHVGGTGLGLAIAKAIVELHKGAIWLESDEGKGATFFFTLPVYVPPREEVEERKKKAEKPKPLPWWKRLFS